MSQRHNDIEDNEIRVISSDAHAKISAFGKRRKRMLTVWLTVAACVIVIGILLYVSLKSDNSDGKEDLFTVVENADSKTAANTTTSSAAKQKGYVEKTDITVNGISLSVFTPRSATARLQTGIETLQDTAAVLVVQAADVRKDNGEIVGTYVSEGNLVSKGQSKSGFCAIINGIPIIGVSDATPYLEQAIETNGYFFRQYPLVMGGQVVENKPKGKSFRKALAERNGETTVVMSKTRLTFHEFAQALVEIGVSNAIYLVGSSTFGFAIDPAGNRIEFGSTETNTSKNINYIVWE